MRRGSTVAIITPMIPETGAVDMEGLRKLLRYHVEQGTDNLCILGTTGEASVLTMEERKLILTTAVAEVKGKIPILVGTGTINPNGVKTFTQQAMDLGCDAALVVTPYYVKPPQRCLIQHMTDIADAVALPVVIYNVPGRTGVDFKDENIAIAAQHPGIIGVKDATGDVSRVETMRRLTNEHASSKDFLLYTGDDEATLDFILKGGDGCISVTANVAANAMHRMVQAARDGKIEEATSINAKLLGLHKNLFCESNPIPTKWAAMRLGLVDSAYCRPPLAQLEQQFESQVEEALREAGLM
jgi:4-hydroxy-tetrahydrodipicolinate synthase